MTTLEILLSAAKKEENRFRVWGLAQECVSRIGFSGLRKVQDQLRKTNPNIFIPPPMSNRPIPKG